MPYINNTYYAANPENRVRYGDSTITRIDRRSFPNNRINGTGPYPSLESLVLRMERESGGRDELSEFYNSDAIFGFAIRAEIQHRANRTENVENRQLNRVLDIGLYDWKGNDRSGGNGGPPLPVRYAAVLGSQLLDRIRFLENRVSSPVSRGKSRD